MYPTDVGHMQTKADKERGRETGIFADVLFKRPHPNTDGANYKSSGIDYLRPMQSYMHV